MASKGFADVAPQSNNLLNPNVTSTRVAAEYGLTQKEFLEYRKTFDLFDKDGGGTISKAELAQVIVALGGNPTDTELNDMMGEVDDDGDGTVDFNEFMHLVKKGAGKGSSRGRKLTSFLAVIDADQNNRIETGGEFRFVMDSGSNEQVQKLLAEGASANSKASHDPYYPLHYALVLRREDFVESLLQYGATANITDEKGRLPLLIACRRGLADSVSNLLQAGADSNTALNEQNWSPLHVAAYYGHLDTVDVIMQLCPHLLNKVTSRDTKYTALHLATQQQHPDVVEYLLRSGSAVDPRCNPSGHTPLHLASIKGAKNIIELLVSFNADVSLTEFGVTRRTALQLARDSMNNDCIAFLIDVENQQREELARELHVVSRESRRSSLNLL